MASILEQAMALSIEEKLQLISALWDSMARKPENIPVLDWQKQESERRIESQRTSHPEPDCYIQDGKIVFANDEQRERFEQKLDEALDEIERGDFVVHKRGDCVRMGRDYLKEKHDCDPTR